MRGWIGLVSGAVLSIYYLYISWLAVHPVEEARVILDNDFTVGKWEDQTYASGCDLFDPKQAFPLQNLWNTLADEFVVAHILGHWGKAIIVRDWRVCVVLSFLFELVEITFQDWLENYKECWWDHIIVDIAVCNALGMVLGLWTVRYFEAQRFDWVGVALRKRKGPVYDALETMVPREWLPYEWKVFSSFRRFAYVMVILVGFNLVENNAFFLKYLLRVPASHVLNKVRLCLWALVAVPALNEYYQFSNKSITSIGPFGFLCLTMMGIETFAVLRWSQESQMFNVPLEPYVIYLWAITFSFGLIWLALFFGIYKRWKVKEHYSRYVLNSIFFLGLIPMVLLFFMGSPDLRWGQESFNNFIKSNNLPWWEGAQQLADRK